MYVTLLQVPTSNQRCVLYVCIHVFTMYTALPVRYYNGLFRSLAYHILKTKWQIIFCFPFYKDHSYNFLLFCKDLPTFVKYDTTSHTLNSGNKESKISTRFYMQTLMPSCIMAHLLSYYQFKK